MFKMFKKMRLKPKFNKESTDVIIPPNHLSFSLNMAKSQGANMPIYSFLHFNVSSNHHSLTRLQYPYTYRHLGLHQNPPHCLQPTNPLPISSLASKISTLLLSLPCLLKSYSKMAERRLSLLAEVLQEWSVLSYFKSTLCYQLILFAVLRCHPCPTSRKVQGHHHRAYVRSRRSGNIHTP